MRLLFLNEKLSYAGTSSYSLDLARALRRLGDEIRLCTTGGDLRKSFAALGVETYVVRFNPFSFSKLLRFLRDFQPDLLHFQNLRSAPFGRRIARKLGVPYLVTVHRAPAVTAPRIADDLLAGVIATNEVIREALVNNLGVPKALIRVIQRGVDTDALSPEREGWKKSRERGWIPVVGSVGSLRAVKGHQVLIKAARRLLDRGVEAMFAIVGEGEEEPGLRRLVKDLGLQYHVTFSPHIPNRRELYRTFDIVVVPTLKAGVGSTALEGMSMGKPVVASAVGELLHIVEDGKTGLLVPEGDEEALADRVQSLIVHPDLCATLGAAARAYVVENFSLAPMVQATRDLYEELRSQFAERTSAVAGLTR